MSERCIFRTRREKNFTHIPNELARDKTLSFKARGLMVFVLSHSDEWQIHQGWLLEQCTEGREALRSAMKELESRGYAVHEEVRKSGKIWASRWTFHDTPKPLKERTTKTKWDTEPEDGKPSHGKPPYGKPSDGNPSPIEDYRKEDQRKEDHKGVNGSAGEEEVTKENKTTLEQELLEEWKTLPPSIPPVRMMTDKRRKTLYVRGKEPAWRDNWREALRKMAQSPFLTGKNDRGWVATVDWFLKPDSVAKLLEGQYADKTPKPEDEQNFWKKHL